MSLKSTITGKWGVIRKDPRTKVVQKWLQRVIVLGIIALIIYQLMDIGWREVLQSLPTNPLFYLVFLMVYISLPLAEVFIYRQVWPIRLWDGIKAFLTKKIYNHEVVGYSGEFYLLLWARNRVGITEKEIFKNIRDNSILSAITSNIVALILLGLLLFTGNIDLSALLDDVSLLYVGAGAIIVVAAIATAYQFRQYLFELPLRKAMIVFAIYFVRFLLHHAGMMLMWMLAIPGTPLVVWFTFLAVFIIVNRIPFVPSKDLVFMWVGIEYARMLDVTLASVAGMFLVYSALNKSMNLTLFLLIAYYSKDPDLEQAVKERDVK